MFNTKGQKRTLYKKANTGKIQQWSIWVNDFVIFTEFGQVDGKLQITQDLIKEGKNLGKVNETTAVQQALLEAESNYQKQLKKGYCKTYQEAESGAVDEVIEGGIAPMLAPSKIYPTFAYKLSWPVIVQPKLDGSRLIAVLKDGKCTLWSRTRKRVNSLPHIAKAVEQLLGKYGDAIYDGEAYSHTYAIQNGFEGLMSLIRKDEPDIGHLHEQIEYWIYDIPSIKHNNLERDRQRMERLKELHTESPLVCVKSAMCNTHEEVMEAHTANIAAGFEGSMVRNNGPYEEGKRSYHLQKLKNFLDAEWPIVNVEEGRGKDVGTAGAFVCKLQTGNTFKCRLKATYERRRELFHHPEQWKGWFLTIQYQELTLDGVPRFPIGKALRKGSE